MRIDLEFPWLRGRDEGKFSFIAFCDDGSKKRAAAGAGVDIERHRSDERARNAGLMENPTDLETFVRAASSELNLVMRDAAAAYVLIKKPVHGVATFESHL